MLTPVKFGLGSGFGNGNQWQSWIHASDLAQIFIHCLEHKLSGIYNGVAPNPISNKELVKAIAKKVKRPFFLPNVPKTILALLLGEVHTMLLESQRVSAQKIESTDFNFQYPNLHLALEDLL